METKRIIAVANQKGGVGKTTTSINLSSALTNYGKRVLLIDMDPQGNASSGVGIDTSLLNKTIYDVLSTSYNINKVIKRTVVKNLDVLPSNIRLASLDAYVISKKIEPYHLLKKELLSAIRRLRELQ